MAQGSGASYTVMMQATAEEFDVFHEQVFLPALEAFQPIAEPEATAETTESAPYREEAVTFPGGAEDVTLAGTLTIPEGDGPFPAIVLVSGSGPQDRDETISGTLMKPFALLADALARAGVAVLRYDDRGVAESTGDFTTALTEDFTADAAAAIAWLQTQPELNPELVGVLGHSEGGMVA
ncbi:MAG: alpha/beta hydrolase, partial [Anaerolineae bacterium]|nr:alpha/beta hydrolase [Anaerolineae bacterium]